jgi:phosphopantothenoylcysteine decarboxylase/phosphopantothenate--cysteine ligase
MKILFCITGGISIYKVPTVIRMLVKSGHSIKVVMTENAAKLVSPIVFQTVSGNDVFSKDFDPGHSLAHIQLGDWADLAVIVPATANTIAKIAGGIADNLLTSVILACDKKKILFPAMNVKMFENPATQANIQTLRERSFEVIDPAYGDLACGYEGKGRLPDEEVIAGFVDRDISEPLKGRSYIVTAGGTLEKIDPVRFISNSSSGRMGFELARVLFKKGAKVLLLYGNTALPEPAYIPSIKIESAQDLLSALEKNLPDYNGLFMAAAPADFKVEKPSASKIKKDKALHLDLVENPDILKKLALSSKGKLLVGFALETEEGIENAKKKLSEKNLDFIVLNRISEEFNPLGNKDNQALLLSKKGNVKEKPIAPKEEIAEWVVEEVLSEFFA